MNDDRIRAAFPTPDVPPTLDAKIDRALDNAMQTRPIRRPLALGFAVTAALAIGLVMLPARPAQASLGSILGALESSVHVRMVQTAIESDGRQVLRQIVDTDGRDQHVYDAAGRLDEYRLGAKVLTYDPFLKAYVESSPHLAPAASFKIRFTPGSGLYAGMESEVVEALRDGRKVIRATVTRPEGDVRFVYDASPETKRPIVGSRQVNTPEGWRTVEITRFEYDAAFRVAPPAPTKVPRLTEAQAETRLRDTLTKETLAGAPLGKDRLVVRRLDMAQDGTVFVAFQRGPKESQGFRGYTFRLTDDLGTVYARAGGTSERAFDEAPSPDGPFEMETFVPTVPVAPRAPRRLRLQAHRFASGLWAGTLERTQRGPDGTLRPYPGILMNAPGHENPQPLDLPEFRIAAPTCDTAPSWAAIFDAPAFGDARLAAATKAEARGAHALEYERWEAAAQAYTEALHIKQEAERLGYGFLSMENDQKGLAKAQSMLRR